MDFETVDILARDRARSNITRVRSNEYMSVPRFQDISTEELILFLDDIHKNIHKDENTDLKKLVLYLYAFLEAKLAIVQQKQSDKETNSIIIKLVDTIEYVFQYRRELLAINFNEEESLAVPGMMGLGGEVKFGQLYEWGLLFAIKHITGYGIRDILSKLKSFIFEIVDIVCARLRGLKHRKNLRDLLIRILDHDMTSLLVPSLSNGLCLVRDNSVHVLARVVHLFSVLHNFEVATKLLLQNSSIELQMETKARTLWFLINLTGQTNSFEHSAESKALDELRSVLLLNFTNYMILKNTPSWNQIALLSGWISDYLNSFDSNNPKSAYLFSEISNRTVSYCLLRLFQFCRSIQYADCFAKSFQLQSHITSASSSSTLLPKILLKALHLVNYHLGLSTNNTEILGHYKLDLVILSPFYDTELDNLIHEISKESYVEGDPSLLICDLLNFDRSVKSSTFVKNNSFDLSAWIKHLRTSMVDQKRSYMLKDKQQLYIFISTLGHIPCIFGDDFIYSFQQCVRCTDDLLNQACSRRISTLRKLINENSDIHNIYKYFITDFLLSKRSEAFNESPILCCSFLLMLFSYFASFRPSLKNMERDPVFSFVMGCLRHRNREVRLTATRILPLYLTAPKDDYLEACFVLIFHELCLIKFDEESDTLYLAESTIRAFGELAIISEGEWLCVLFIKMVDLLGEANEQHANFVYTEFLNVSVAKCVTPYKLLSPFLPSVAERIVKQPRLLQRISELLGISKRYFLNRTREYTTPMFLEYYKHDYIQEIALASNTTKWKLIAKNLPRIMAIYLCKDETIDENYICSVLSNASPEYSSVSFSELFSSIGEITWYILLQIQKNEKGELQNEKRLYNALKYVSKMDLKRSGRESLTSSPNFDHLENLLGDHVLELVQRFSENAHHIKGIKPYLEKVGSLNAIEFLIRKNPRAITSALGQISTCLQASLENSVLELPAIKCWNVLVYSLLSEDLISLFDITISLILQKFETLQYRSRQVAADILKRLFMILDDTYLKYSLYYFSLPFIKNLDKYFQASSSIRSIKKPKSKINYFQEFSRRIGTNNKYVVQQALDDLINFITKNQEQCQNEDFKDPNFKPYVSEILKALLDTAAHFKNENVRISSSCAKALAIIGALDPNRFNLKAVDSHVIVLHDFRDHRENAEFLRHFMELMVIKLFWSSNDPVKQLFSAYSMQRFLEVLGLGNNLVYHISEDNRNKIWNQFSDLAKSTLTPLLTSKYVSPPSRFEPMTFPLYKQGGSHEKWLIDFTSNLLKRPISSMFQKENNLKAIIFQACSMLVRNHDMAICLYLLKYAALTNVINGDESCLDDVKIEFLNILRMDSSSLPPDKSEQLKCCYQSVLEVLDYFNVWVSYASHYLGEYELVKNESQILKKRITLVKSFLSDIPMSVIALRSAEYDSYERAILYLEKCFKNREGEDSLGIDDLDIISKLTETYASINDYDALAGVLKKFATNNLSETLKAFQYSDNWSLAQASFEALSETGDNSEEIRNNTKLLKSLNDHALYEEVLDRLEAKSNRVTLARIPLEWSMMGLQAAISLGDKYLLQRWIYITDSVGKPHDVETITHYRFAKGLLELLERRHDDINAFTDLMYRTIGTSLVSSKSSSFSRNSNLMVQLHSAFDLGLILSSSFRKGNFSGSDSERILKARSSNIEESFEIQWKILNTHKIGYTLGGDLGRTSENLLACSRISRNNMRFDISTKCILKAMSLNDKGANIEYAELLWAQGNQTEAIQTLNRIIEENEFKDSKQRSSVQLQYAEWLDESNHSSSADIISEYIKAYKIDESWEKPYYELGKYYNKIMDSNEDPSGFFEQQIIRFFLKALASGSTFIFEALPKFMTIWLDFAQKPKKSKEAENALTQIIHEINSYIDIIPIYVWYTSLTQILSRIAHKHVGSAQVLFKLVYKVIQAYPKHSLWFVLSHLNSNDQVRKLRVSEILKRIQNSDSSTSKDLQSARELFSSLIKIASHKILKKSVRKLSLSKDFNVQNLSQRYTSLVIPVRSNLEIRLPSLNHTKNIYSAFPKSSSVTFEEFDDLVNVFHSLQMPRQLSIRGSDGLAYRLMVKKDDTRKDAKVVEFSTMVNRLLSVHNDARKRGLFIANYAVVPLAENMGVIEFVQNVATMKSVVSEQRRRLGRTSSDRKIFIKLNEAQKAVKNSLGPNRTALNRLVKSFELICEENPPVLHSWFVDQFSDPRSWYLARNAFIRSAAVMSIIGYIIGLGDRHCENILFFKKTGFVLHIDFDCLFEKGKTLPTPEIVPFRLTQNMIDAMSISGIEGSFRIACEVTTSILRENEAPLMNILETLIYDPLLDWKTLQNPQEHLKKVQRKIRGLVSEDDGLPMNVHGQVDVLIQEATSVENLAQMYGGWAPYI